MVLKLETGTTAPLSPDDVHQFLVDRYGNRALSVLKDIRGREVSTGPMQPNCRVVVNMPVLHLEKNLYHALAQYLNQDMSKKGKEFVISLLINGPIGVNLEASEPYKAALKFMADHPEQKVVIRTANYPEESVNISKLRKDLVGLTLLQAAEVKGLDIDNLIQFTHDADLQKLAPSYLSGNVKAFDENPKLGAIAGFYDYPESDFYQDHLFLATQKFEDILTLMINAKFDNFTMKGGATAFRTSDYLEVGGIGEKRRMSELRPLYKNLRGRDKDSAIFSRKLGTVMTSARRQMMALGYEVPLSRSHDSFGQKGDLAEKYQAPLGELEIPEVANKVTSPGFKEKLELQLSHLYEKELMLNKSGVDRVNAFFKRAGFFAGLQLDFKDGKVIIKDMSVLKKNILERYSNY